MAKEKEEVKTPKKEVYTISETVLNKGYRAKVDNKVIHIQAPIKKFGQVTKEGFIAVQDGFDKENGKPIMKTVDALTDLTDQQLKELVYAGVIVLTKEQEKEFKTKFLSV